VKVIRISRDTTGSHANHNCIDTPSPQTPYTLATSEASHGETWMGWLETISSALGTGAGGAALGGAIYAGSIALESEMRSEAKNEIARLVNNATINPDVKVTANFVYHAFETIFSPRHWSVRWGPLKACFGTRYRYCNRYHARGPSSPQCMRRQASDGHLSWHDRRYVRYSEHQPSPCDGQ
jgi:hypothetical protein